MVSGLKFYRVYKVKGSGFTEVDGLNLRIGGFGAGLGFFLRALFRSAGSKASVEASSVSTQTQISGFRV